MSFSYFLYIIKRLDITLKKHFNLLEEMYLDLFIFYNMYNLTIFCNIYHYRTYLQSNNDTNIYDKEINPSLQNMICVIPSAPHKVLGANRTKIDKPYVE